MVGRCNCRYTRLREDKFDTDLTRPRSHSMCSVYSGHKQADGQAERTSTLVVYLRRNHVKQGEWMII